jgi:ribosomal protein L13
MVLTKTKIIDGRDHLLGRLASVVSKELLAGQSIVIVRCDEICVSGSRKLTPPPLGFPAIRCTWDIP